MRMWIMIVYIGSLQQGGPVSMEFYTREACVQAISTIKSDFGWYFTRAICINKSTGKED